MHYGARSQGQNSLEGREVLEFGVKSRWKNWGKMSWFMVGNLS